MTLAGQTHGPHLIEVCPHANEERAVSEAAHAAPVPAATGAAGAGATTTAGAAAESAADTGPAGARPCLLRPLAVLAAARRPVRSDAAFASAALAAALTVPVPTLGRRCTAAAAA